MSCPRCSSSFTIEATTPTETQKVSGPEDVDLADIEARTSVTDPSDSMWEKVREHFEFRDFLAPKLIRGFYALAWVIAGLACVGAFIGTAAREQPPEGLGAFFAAALGSLIFLLGLRIWLELFMVVFSIHDRLKELTEENG